MSDKHLIVVGEMDSTPACHSSEDLEGLLKKAYAELVKARTGWAYLIIDGKRCVVSSASQVFHVRMPDGTVRMLSDPAGPVFTEDGRFCALVEPPNDV